MRMIAKVAVIVAVSAGALMAVGGQAVAADGSGGSSQLPGSNSGWPPGTAGTPLAVLLCALQGGVVGSAETSPPKCYLPG